MTTSRSAAVTVNGLEAAPPHPRPLSMIQSYAVDDRIQGAAQANAMQSVADHSDCLRRLPFGIVAS